MSSIPTEPGQVTSGTPKVRMDAAFNTAFRPQGTTPVKDYAKDLGEGVMEALLQGVAERVKDAYRGGGSGTGSTDLFAALDAYDRIERLRRKLTGQEDSETPSGDKGFWMFLAKQSELQTQMLLKMMEQHQAPATNPADQFAQAMQTVAGLMTLFKDITGGNQQREDELKPLFMQFLMSQLQRNPAQEWQELRRQFLEEFEQDRSKGQVINFEQWKAQQEFDLRREEIKAQKEAEESRSKAQAQLLSGVFAVASGRGPQEAPSAAAPPVTTPGLTRYQCANCHTEFAIPGPVRPAVTCPACQTRLQSLPADQAPPPAPPEENLSALQAAQNVGGEYSDGY